MRKEDESMLFQKEKKLVAVATGKAIPLSQVPDEAFASGLLGIGFAVEPTAGTVYSPMSGKIVSVADAKHAYTMESDDGIELLVHIGINTVCLKGKGFLPMVSEGDSVRAGDVLARVDLSEITGEEISSQIVVVISNPEALTDWKPTYGKGLGGKSQAATYRPKRKGVKHD